MAFKTPQIRRSVLCLGFAFAGLSLTYVERASAQGAADKAAAEALFDSGVNLLKEGKVDEACEKLASSQRIDPGIGTLLYLGECYKQAGRTASAWATFREAESKARAAGEDERAEIGRKRADEIEGSLSRLAFRVAKENMDVPGLHITQGNVTVSRALWGTSVPVDPGKLQITAEAEGYETYRTTAIVGKSAEATLTIPALIKLPEAQEPSPTPTTTAPPPVAVQEGNDGSGQRTTGLILGGAGIIGLGVGGVFGFLAMEKSSDADEFCSGATCETGSEGVKLTDQARSLALGSTIGFIAGGAFLVGGAVLYLTAPSKKETARINLSPTPGGAHLSLEAKF